MQKQQQRHQLISLFLSTFLTSLAPLLFYALISVFNEISFFETLKSTILQGYSNLLSFSIMMISINVISQIVWNVIAKKSDHHFENINTLPTTHHQKESDLIKGKGHKRPFLMVLLYLIIYFSFISLRSTFNSFQISPISRILEQHEEECLESPQFSLEPDLKTLSVGKTLGFLNINPISIILSKTGKLAYIITRYSGGLKVIDISDHSSPTIIGSLDLSKINIPEMFKTLKLSADEKTLFAASIDYFEIIDVTNPQSPSLISSQALYKSDVPSESHPTLALSQDETTLYIASLGLQIYNITKISHPKLIFSQKSSRVTSLALLPNTNTLAYAEDGQLKFFNISDPTKPRLLNSYSSKFEITSIALSKNNKEIYAAGLIGVGQGRVMLEKINVQDPLSAQSIEVYNLSIKSLFAPSIIAISPNETNIFIATCWADFDEFDVIGYDLLNKKSMIKSNSLLYNTIALTIVPHSHHVLVGSNERFGILEFMKNYPNTKAFCRFDNPNQFIDLNSSINLVEPSETGDIWLVSNRDVFYTYNMTNDASPQEIASYRLPSKSETKHISINKNRGFIQTETEILVLKISSDLTPFGSLIPKNQLPINTFQISDNIAYIIQIVSQSQFRLNAINFESFSSIIENSFAEITTRYEFFKAGIVYDPQIVHRQGLLFVMLDQIYIYNTSNPMAPILISSQSVATDAERLLFTTFSPDTKTLFVLTRTTASTSAKTLKIFDISDLTNFKFIQDFALPKIVRNKRESPFILSKDMTKGFLVVDKNILILDLRNLTSPTILGLAPFAHSYGSILNFFLSPDEKTGYIQIESQVEKINLDLTYTLYLSQENFLIGKKYSDPVMFLNANKETGFLLMDPKTSYKIVKLSLSDFQVSSSQTSPLMTYTSLPSWINFDYENQILTVESTAQRDLGSYTLYSVASKKISLQAFDSVLQDFNNPVNAQDLLTLLIILGYVDNQRFLTMTFGSYFDFLLPSQYETKEKKSIYQILESHRIETFTGFSILPSLNLSTTPGKFLVRSNSKNSIKIDIRLLDPKFQFNQKTYGTVVPLITENRNRLIIEGPLDHINQALRELVININSTGSTICQGEITINDNLNPIIKQAFPNISNYFFHNDIPLLDTSHNLSVQQQIDPITLYTGQYFSINLDPETFKDQYSDSLTYRLVQREDHQDDDSLPSWLSFQGLTLKGTPPEEIFHRQFKFGLIIKNEFKQIEIPVVLNVHISWQFIGKLFVKYSPYILTAIGLFLTANKISNILLKKRYRHPKDFYIKVGQEITSSTIFPIRFIAEEKLEGDLIWKKLEKKSLLNENEEEIKIAIKEAFNKMSANDKEKLKLYSREAGQKRVNQYILNKLVLWQLNSSEEKATKVFFDKLKNKWVDFIEYNDFCGFTVNENNFKPLIGEIHVDNPSESLNDSLLLLKSDAVNLDLLKKALIVYATKNHELDSLHANLDILVHLQTPKSGIFKFLKRDLKNIRYSEKGRLTYGITYQIEKDVLKIYGTPEESFEGKVLVIQIVNSHQRILKEIWIHGGDSNLKNDGEMSNETKAEGMKSFDESQNEESRENIVL